MNANDGHLNLTGAPPPVHSWWRRLILPTTKAGWWAAALLFGFALFLAVFQIMVASGQRGGAAFFANLWLTVPFLTAVVAAIGGGLAAGLAIFARRERSVLSFVALLLGIFVLLFVVGEIALTH